MRTKVSRLVTVAMVGLVGCLACAQLMAQVRPPIRPPIRPVPRPRIPLALPDLVVSLQGPDRAIPGTEIPLTVTVSNKGARDAPGSAESANAYYVDLILSADADLPVKLAVQPAYAGLTVEDFVEDMLLVGGRISNTRTVRHGESTRYTLTTRIPRKAPPGVYCLGAVVDPADRIAELDEDNNTACHRIAVGATPMPGVRVPPGVTLWVMPYAVGGTPLNNIQPDGLTDYVDGLGCGSMEDSPFGGRLGFRHGYHDAIPTPRISHYRWLYRSGADTTWQEFAEPVSVHYVKEEGGVVTFPVYTLGPKSIAGKSLYEFRPHQPPGFPATRWPTTDWFGDIYSGFLNSQTLPADTYQVKLEIYDSAGNQVVPDDATFHFIVPSRVLPDGTVVTDRTTSLDGGGFVFNLHLDNRPCTASIDAPLIGSSTVADECGFLLYASKSQQVRIAFRAAHPANFARFGFRIVRGIQEASTVSGQVSDPSPGEDYAGDGSGNFHRNFTVAALLGPCPEKAAFSENLDVCAKATNGWGQRLNWLDAHAVRAFALAPQTLR